MKILAVFVLLVTSGLAQEPKPKPTVKECRAHLRVWLPLFRLAFADAACNGDGSCGLGRWRWVVERIFAWLNQFRRLRVRYEKRADIHEAFLSLGCALICWSFLRADWVAS